MDNLMFFFACPMLVFAALYLIHLWIYPKSGDDDGDS